jgi:two-component system chemotaxis response regulator CheY
MPKTIVVIDDSESIRELIGLLLENAGHNVEKAADGKDALRLFDGRDIDLIVTDLNMPHMDGITFIKEVKKIEVYNTVPILVLTTESQVVRKVEAKEAGATGWIVKPFIAEKFLEIAKKVMQ